MKILVIILACITFAAAESVTIGWQASPEPAAAGYELRYGTESGNPTEFLDAGSNLRSVVDGLTVGTTYYFTVCVYNADGLRSSPSPELSFRVEASAPTLPPSVIAASDGLILEIQESDDLTEWHTRLFYVVPMSSRKFYRLKITKP